MAHLALIAGTGSCSAAAKPSTWESRWMFELSLS